ncbi:potassium transporter TrkA [Terrihabitans soli]|uniref:Potassium transporter TrkA n=1 Tax=Terrihabitans soli TaxID=708113 RepID=A0A6S6QK67_9HYPH|nr:monovalent cation:proton antiporter-2 (CPA2) family protein [Terrihabitans soli]BCJ91683.1 potassium transporter TrkA [Terrihabitans soli]
MEHGPTLPPVLIVFLAAAVIAPTLFNRLGLGAIVGYLAAGLVLGPSGLDIFVDPDRTLRIAELGVVLLLFLIGLELEFSRLLDMRRDIFGLGAAQLVITTGILAALGYWLGFNLGGSVAAGFALALSSTALATKILSERGSLTRAYGQRTFSVLLAQDLAIVPAFALIPALAGGADQIADPFDIGIKVGAAILVLSAIVLTGRYLINPVLHFLVRNGGHDVMVPVALLLVFGAAIGSQVIGLSMALGAFLAGLLLAESSYRHELEVSVAPFRALLLALFFMGVGMVLDIKVVASAWPYLLVALVILFSVKFAVAAGLSFLRGSAPKDAIRVGSLLAPTSEFAFVLIPLAVSTRLFNADIGQLVLALGVLSMMVGPPSIAIIEYFAHRMKRPGYLDGVEKAEESLDGTGRTAVVIGFGRFGQTAAQFLISEGIETTLVDHDAEGVRLAAKFGFKVYYGDGSRVDVLRACGARDAQIVLVCVHSPVLSMKIVDLVKRECPLAKILVRAIDRDHWIQLHDRNVEFEIRETFESAMKLGHAALRALGFSEDHAAEIEADIRRRDFERLELQKAGGGREAGKHLLHRQPDEPLLGIEQKGVALNPEAAAALGVLPESKAPKRKAPAKPKPKSKPKSKKAG